MFKTGLKQKSAFCVLSGNTFRGRGRQMRVFNKPETARLSRKTVLVPCDFVLDRFPSVDLGFFHLRARQKFTVSQYRCSDSYIITLDYFQTRLAKIMNVHFLSLCFSLNIITAFPEKIFNEKMASLPANYVAM